MKKLTILLACVMLAGCSVTKYLPTWRSFPEQKDKTLLESCPELKKIEGDQIAITQLLKAVVDNYNLYYECSLKNDNWITWYNENKKKWETHKWKD